MDLLIKRVSRNKFSSYALDVLKSTHEKFEPFSVINGKQTRFLLSVVNESKLVFNREIMLDTFNIDLEANILRGRFALAV